MSSIAERPELVGFFSYSREDDEDSKGALSALRDRIQRELRGQLGRSTRNFRLWQDKEAIAPGTLWESEIKAAIAQSVFFIPIITPTTIRSGYCQFEFEAFLAREHTLGRSDLIFPILYIRVPELEDSVLREADPVLPMIARRQYVDWREFRHREVFSTAVGEAIERLCGKIAEALRRQDTSEAEKDQRRQEEAERQRRREDETQRQERAHHAGEAARQRQEEERPRRREQAPTPQTKEESGGKREQKAPARERARFAVLAVGVSVVLAAVLALALALGGVFRTPTGQEAATPARTPTGQNAADDVAVRLAQQKAAEDAAARQAQQKAADEAAARQAQQKAAEDAAARQAQQKAAEDAAARQAQQKAADEAAAQQAKQKAADDAAARQAQQKAADEAAAQQAKQKAADDAAARQAQQKAADDAAARQAQQKAADEAAAQQAKQKAADDAAARQAQQKAADDAAARQAQQAASQIGPLQVAEAQRLMTSMALDTGGADGKVGPRTQEMVRAFQLAVGEPPTGEITVALLGLLRGPPPPAPERVTGLFTLAAEARRQERTADAIRLYEGGLKLAPKDADGLLALGDLRRDQADFEAARRTYEAIQRGGGPAADIARQRLAGLPAPQQTLAMQGNNSVASATPSNPLPVEGRTSGAGNGGHLIPGTSDARPDSGAVGAQASAASARPLDPHAGTRQSDKSSTCTSTDTGQSETVSGGSEATAKITMNNDGGWCWSNGWQKNGRTWLLIDAFVVSSPPAHGQVVLSDAGNKRTRIAYRPDRGFTGTDMFVVHIKYAEVDITYTVTVVP